MERLIRNRRTLMAVAAMVVISFVLAALMMSASSALLAEVSRWRSRVAEERVLASKGKALQNEWGSRRGDLVSSGNSEALLSAWVKSLLASAQSQGVTLEKLEPSGVRSAPTGKRVEVFLSFKSDARRCAKFLYLLGSADPLSEVGSFRLRQDEGAVFYTCEFLLVRAVS